MPQQSIEELITKRNTAKTKSDAKPKEGKPKEGTKANPFIMDNESITDSKISFNKIQTKIIKNPINSKK